MKIKLIGLGKMGTNIALNLKDHGHQVIGYDVNEKARAEFETFGIPTVSNLSDLLRRDAAERHILLLFVPNQKVDTVIEQIIPHLLPKDIIVDAGNSNFNVSIKRFHLLKGKGIHFIDVGTSGGTYGARHGACLMVGGEKEVVDFLEPLFLDLSVKDGYSYVGKPGSGHFVKMVHNGIEYGMMQAIGEGFDLLEASPFELDYEKIAKMWNHGSIIESALIGYIHSAFAKDPKLSEIQGKIDDSGEGMWMIEEALKYKVSLPVITQSLYARYKSRDEDLFGEKVVAAMRKEFGGHAVYKK
ncbi:MAG: decarboxylating 6-phosphogluconate dehydrogenase [Acholeplasmataceae bacterium]|nr:decarboxylating 6-phosphogluconate dehydrogenase [Acholeplasmataceae bacterium]